MSTGEAYVRQIGSIDEALKRLNEETRTLRKQRGIAKQRLHDWMKKNGHEEYQGYKLAKIAPKPKVPRKKAKEKKEDAMRLFRDIGVNDPEELWVEFLRTQKYQPDQNPEEQ
jgi:hypothetical protein